ncbi:hypothetical protein PO124_20040 [Bacillus licheniformis]|nr:hypothetical protein [Bacillus licheniformis]
MGIDERLTSVLASAFAVILLFGCTANEQAGQETKKKAKETAGEQVLRLNNEMNRHLLIRRSALIMSHGRR